MNNLHNTYAEIVETLNEMLHDKHGETEMCFAYLTNGYWDGIMFGETIIWDSENSEQKWVESKNDYESFMPFILRTYRNYIKKLSKLKI